MRAIADRQQHGLGWKIAAYIYIYIYFILIMVWWFYRSHHFQATPEHRQVRIHQAPLARRAGAQEDP